MAPQFDQDYREWLPSNLVGVQCRKGPSPVGTVRWTKVYTPQCLQVLAEHNIRSILDQANESLPSHCKLFAEISNSQFPHRSDCIACSENPSPRPQARTPRTHRRANISQCNEADFGDSAEEG